MYWRQVGMVYSVLTCSSMPERIGGTSCGASAKFDRLCTRLRTGTSQNAFLLLFLLYFCCYSHYTVPNSVTSFSLIKSTNNKINLIFTPNWAKMADWKIGLFGCFENCVALTIYQLFVYFYFQVWHMTYYLVILCGLCMDLWKICQKKIQQLTVSWIIPLLFITANFLDC